ncbi:hypothetical protein AA103196_0494 [Ameyamaea chiangmaiensis NBRC 103196]|uniref:hypothetical protein n=1 Tax=Ameyamaea chiangmaiensis TaxID=442969 RepID=UPI001BAFF972|nr:hypothetical protein [Ameyamaea chiangmaiensis]MBS4074891.1 hypothetical protein [Ameyamaea chiangmaiensis]GBQ63121.1 hypothetical protein AA103196_0494 [Ameyamaea chiangmaiensis NBRC 103196]
MFRYVQGMEQGGAPGGEQDGGGRVEVRRRLAQPRELEGLAQEHRAARCAGLWSQNHRASGLDLKRPWQGGVEADGARIGHDAEVGSLKQRVESVGLGPVQHSDILSL